MRAASRTSLRAAGRTIRRAWRPGCALALLSAVFPAGFLASFKAGLVERLPDWGPALWPTSVMLFGTDGRGQSLALGAELVAASLAGNALLWMSVGLLAYWFFDQLLFQDERSRQRPRER